MLGKKYKLSSRDEVFEPKKQLNTFDEIDEVDQFSKLDQHTEHKKPDHNQNRSNPFTGELNSIMTDGDDQEQMQQGFKPDHEGFAPMMAKRKLRKKALWDMPSGGGAVPGMGDPSQGLQAPFGGAGEIPDPNKEVNKNWDDTWDHTRSQKKYKRKNNDSLEVVDQTHLDSAGD